jgi:hypothetical protein
MRELFKNQMPCEAVVCGLCLCISFVGNKHIAPPAQRCHNSKNTTFLERGKPTGRGDAIASKEERTSPLSRPF